MQLFCVQCSINLHLKAPVQLTNPKFAVYSKLIVQWCLISAFYCSRYKWNMTYVMIRTIQELHFCYNWIVLSHLFPICVISRFCLYIFIFSVLIAKRSPLITQNRVQHRSPLKVCVWWEMWWGHKQVLFTIKYRKKTTLL